MPETYRGVSLTYGAGACDLLVESNEHVKPFVSGGKSTLGAEAFARYEAALREAIGLEDQEPLPGTPRGGGNGNNIATHHANLGRHAFMATAVGTDPYGSFIKRNLQAHGVDTTHVMTRDGHQSSAALISVVDGQRQITSSARSDLAETLSESAVQKALTETNPDIVVVTSTKSVRLNRWIFRSLANLPDDKKPFTMFLPGSSEWDDHPHDLVDAMGVYGPDLLIGNETEMHKWLESITGREIDGKDYPRMAYLAAQFAGHAVCTAGTDGMFLESRAHLGRKGMSQKAIWVEKPVDTTGAGDAAAALLAVHMSEMEFGDRDGYRKALEHAAQSGADAVMAPGATGNVLPKFPHLLNT